jgi:DNA repair exonuclease SbcCD ATPase subunit
MTRTRLVSIELEGFRGFAKKQWLSLDADAVLVRGDNGSGKTSLVDGLLWLFSGELDYLAERVRKLRRNEPIVQSRFTDARARVALALAHGGEQYVFERTDEKITTLTGNCNGIALADPETALAGAFGHPSAKSFREAVLTWGLLRQDAVRSALDNAGGALHQRLAAIVGLDQVSAFADSATAVARGMQTERTAKKKAVSALQERHDQALHRYQEAERELAGAKGTSGNLITEIEVLAQRSNPPLSLVLPDTMELPAVADLGRVIGGVADLLREVASLRRAAVQAETAASGGIAEAESALKQAQQRLEGLARQGPATTRLAEAALEVLDGDQCPVCGQSIVEGEVRHHLEEMIGHADRLFSTTQQASDAVAHATTQLSEARERDRQRRERERREGEVLAALATFRETIPGIHLVLEVGEDAERIDALAAALTEFVSSLRELYRNAFQASSAQLERLVGDVNAVAGSVADAKRDLEGLEERYEQAKTLEKASHAAAETIVARALAQLQPNFAEVFDRLNPNPAFTELRARQDVLRNVNQVVPIVRDPQRGVDANPLLVFSEGQLNVVALSYFLGMALNAREATLPFLVLDDPLQALDTIAVLGFGDLCRRMREERQLLITAHDRRFADILERKLEPREEGITTIVHDFGAWTREGPSISTTTPELAEVIPLIRRAS